MARKRPIPNAQQIDEAQREAARRHVNRSRKVARTTYLGALSTARGLIDKILSSPTPLGDGTDLDVRRRDAHEALDMAARAVRARMIDGGEEDATRPTVVSVQDDDLEPRAREQQAARLVEAEVQRRRANPAALQDGEKMKTAVDEQRHANASALLGETQNETALRVLTEQGHTPYAATRAVFDIPPDKMENSAEYQAARRAKTKRRNQRDALSAELSDAQRRELDDDIRRLKTSRAARGQGIRNARPRTR